MIRVILTLTFFALLGVYLQSAFPPAGSHSFVCPDIVFILTIVIGLNFRNVWGLFGAFLLGLLSDFASAQYIGSQAIGAVVGYWIVIFISQKVFVENFFGLFLLGLIAAVGKQIVTVLMIIGFVGFNLGGGVIAKVVLLESLFTAALAPLIVPLVSLAEGRSKSSFSTSLRSSRKY